VNYGQEELFPICVFLNYGFLKPDIIVLSIVCHRRTERFFVYKELTLCISCKRDGGRPSKAGLQEQALNNHGLLW
jgi:hypothetical protein